MTRSTSPARIQWKDDEDRCPPTSPPLETDEADTGERTTMTARRIRERTDDLEANEDDTKDKTTIQHGYRLLACR